MERFNCEEVHEAIEGYYMAVQMFGLSPETIKAARTLAAVLDTNLLVERIAARRSSPREGRNQ